ACRASPCRALGRGCASRSPRQQIQRARERSRGRTVAVAGQGFAQGIHIPAVLEREEADGNVPRVHVNSGAVLPGVEEYFSEVAVLEPADACGVLYSAMLEAQQFVAAAVREALAEYNGRHSGHASLPKWCAHHRIGEQLSETFRQLEHWQALFVDI